MSDQPSPSTGRDFRPAAVALACILVGIFHLLQAPPNDDDVYHLHSIWLVSQGYVPYRDFYELHFPGMWVVATPLAWLARDGVTFLLAARLLMVLGFGAAVATAGILAKVEGWGWVTLLAGGVWALEYGEVFYFRVEYVTLALAIAHLRLAALALERNDARLALWAAVPLGLACTMSLRPLVFLPVLPLLAWRYAGEQRKSMVAATLQGLLVGAAPCLLYLAAHNLWAKAWFWSVQFVGQGQMGLLSGGPLAYEWMVLTIGLAAALVLVKLRRDDWTPASSVLIAGWACSTIMILINPLRPLAYPGIHCDVLTVALVAAVLGTLLRRERVETARVATVALLLVTLVGSGLYMRQRIRHFDREEQQLEFQLMRWLQRVAGEEPVVLVAPLHPIVVADATDIQNAWHYGYWIKSPHIRARLRDTAQRMLANPPPVIAADPWGSNTGNRNLIEWLWLNEAMTAPEASQVAALLQGNYVEVHFPRLAFESGGPPNGDTFWVRADRLEGSRPPKPHALRRPSTTPP